MNSIAENFQSIVKQIATACTQAGRETAQVQLLAVSKTRQADELRALYALGQRQFGENYLQEAEQKIAALQDLAICWHFIGPVQSNKTRALAEHFDWVQSVDRLKIAERLAQQRPAHLAPLNVCVQVNISAEASKSGCLPDQTEALLAQMMPLSGIRVRGLMAIPKASDDPQEQRRVLAAMQQLFQRMQQRWPALDTLSMGMSADMGVAIEQGATMVRIGTALFGPRPARPQLQDNQ